MKWMIAVATCIVAILVSTVLVSTIDAGHTYKSKTVVRGYAAPVIDADVCVAPEVSYSVQAPVVQYPAPQVVSYQVAAPQVVSYQVAAAVPVVAVRHRVTHHVVTHRVRHRVRLRASPLCP